MVLMMPTSEQAVQVFAPMRIIKEYKAEQNDVQQAVVQAPQRMECSFYPRTC